MITLFMSNDTYLLQSVDEFHEDSLFTILRQHVYEKAVRVVFEAW